MTTTLGRTLWWAALYAVASAVGRATALPETGLALFWPAAGVAALWIHRSPRPTLAPNLAVLLATTVAVNVALDVDWLPALLFAAANCAAAATVRQVLGWAHPPVRIAEGRAQRDEAMGSIHGVVALAQASVAASLASAPCGVLAGYLVSDHASVLGVVAWVVRNTTGVFVVAGVVLAVVAARHDHRPGASLSSTVTTEDRPRGVGELVLTVVAAGAAFDLVFEATQGVSLAFLLVAVAAFVGFRFSPVVAAVLTTAAGVSAVAASMAATGPFATIADPVVRSITVQLFVLVQAAISLMLSWAVRERHDVTRELIEARRQADERARLLDAVTERLDHGVAVVDAAGRVVVQNPAAARLVPGSEGRIAGDGHPSSYGVHRADGTPMDRAEMPQSIALATGESAAAALVVRRPGLADSYVDVRVDPLDLDGDPARRLAVMSMRDDTAHRRHVDELETFAGAVAHDLRNPLAAMSSWLEVLTDHLAGQGTDDEGAREALGRISAAGDRMSQLIADLLAYATAASAPLQLRDIDLDAAVCEVSDEVAASRPGGATVLSEGLGTMVGDPSLVRQVLANVIGNAVKYTADDVRPIVRLRAERAGADLVIRVTDNGVGVPEPLQATVFERFTRISSSGVQRPGSGLGLALCARAVERHDGTITLGSGPGGVGSTVTITVPQPVGHAPAAVA